MIDLKDFYKQASASGLGDYEAAFSNAIEQRLRQRYHGDLKRWLQTVDELPSIQPDRVLLQDTITIGSASQLDQATSAQFIDCLRMLHPWRKGPFSLFGIDLDSEWRSDLKWQRVLPHIQPLTNRKVLDIGCGNAYYCWRMLEQQPEWVLGVDPSQKFMMQFYIMKRYMQHSPVFYLPLRSEDLPTGMAAFDTVFSMGVLYHRRSPFDHLEELKQCLLPGGELVLETLVIDGGPNTVLVPSDRYAQMPNVWFIPSCETLKLWLERTGFEQVRVVDIHQTTIHEQRATEWMQFQSLKDYLAPGNCELTVEGYPAPKRAVFIARKP